MNEIYHHGIKGQKWGVRRYQNEDGTRTAAGRRHEMSLENKNVRAAVKNRVKVARSTGFLAGHDNAEKIKNADDKVNDAIAKRAEKRAELAREKALAKGRSADKAERRAYAKDMRSVGLAGSARDAQLSGAGTKLYDSIAAKKGEAFAKSVEKTVLKQSVAIIATSAAVSIGSAFVSAYMDS